MIQSLLYFLFVVGIFCLVVWGGFWVCAKAGLPKFVVWAWGILVLVVLILALAGQIPGWPGPSQLFNHRG